MISKENNFAYIDGQNLHLGVNELGWSLDYRKFRTYLREKYGVIKAYYFIGYLPENQKIYNFLQEVGFILVFKPILSLNDDGKPKGNIDADLVLRTMIDYSNYDKAVIITSDGDFYSLVEYLYDANKLSVVLSPQKNKCSVLLRKKAKEKINFLDYLKNKLGYHNTLKRKSSR